MGSIAGACIALWLFGCATAIAPKTNVSQRASYDNNVANSGILGIAPDGGRIVTLHFRDRYNALIDLYGDQFNPALKRDSGIGILPVNSKKTSRQAGCHIDKEHYIKMGQMVQWKLDGRPGTGVIKKLWNKFSILRPLFPIKTYPPLGDDGLTSDL